jgi:hypothetical protein
MHRERVESEALRSVGYEPRRRMLEIEFHSGEIYRYFDVPPDVHVGLMRAESIGRYFSEHIRDAGFDVDHVGVDDE